MACVPKVLVLVAVPPLATNPTELPTHRFGEPGVIVIAEGVGFTVTVIELVDAVHGLFEILHVNVYVPGPPAGVNTAVGLDKELNCDVKVLGPLTDQAPVPTVGVLAAKVTVPDGQID